MAQIVNNDKLTYILTNYGLDRVAEVLSTPGLSITMTKIKVGDANGEYYEPTVDMTGLKNPIPEGEFPITEKELLEDNLTVSFRSLIPEKFGGCDIREVGIYETVDDVDYLFALGTQQPFVKPSPDDDYFISIDYYAFLKSQNLAEVYDKIYLDPDVSVITDKDFEDLLKTFLFAQANLIDQVGHNSYSIGLNRASQLEDKIEKDRAYNSNFAMNNNYLNLSSTLGQDNIFSYWLFDYTKENIETPSIRDLGPKGVALSTNKSINLYSRKYYGVTPTLEFSNEDYYYLNKEVPLAFLNDDETSDSDFTIFYCLKPLGEGNRTILARSNYAIGSCIYEFYETSDNRIAVKLYSDLNNYITFMSVPKAVPDGEHSVVLSYQANMQSMIAFVNGNKVSMNAEITGNYTHMNSALTTLYAFMATPLSVVYADSSTVPTELYSSKGAPNDNPMFTLSDGLVLFNGNACIYDESMNVNVPTLYAYTYGLESIYVEDEILTESTVLYNSDHSVYTGNLFKLAISGDTVIIQCVGYPTTRDDSKDIEGREIYAWKSESSPQFIWGNNNISPTVFYDSNGNLYQGSNWTVVNGVVFYNNLYAAEYNSQYNKNVPFVEAASYITDENNNKINPINSQIGILGVSKVTVTPTKAREMSMILSTAFGETSCMLTS